MLAETDRHLWDLARRRLFRPVDVAFGVLAIACTLGLRIPEAVQYIPFAVSLVLLGLPHGALDHLVLSRIARRAPDARAVLAIVALYFMVGGTVVTLWYLSPAIAFVGFIAMTWFHWGQGDVFVEATRVDAGRPSGVTRVGMLVVRGALPMVVPLIAFPTVYLNVFRDTTGVIAAPEFDGAAVVESGGLRIALAVALVVVAATTFIGTARARWATPAGRRAWRGDIGEVLLLGAFFASVPPVLAVGLYFCFWHSLRHIVRLSLLDPGSRTPLERGRFLVALRRFAAQSAPITIAALGLLVVLFFAVPRAGVSSGALLGLYLVLISALTLPHVVVVSIMDRRQRVWETDSPSRSASMAPAQSVR